MEIKRTFSLDSCNGLLSKVTYDYIYKAADNEIPLFQEHKSVKTVKCKIRNLIRTKNLNCLSMTCRKPFCCEQVHQSCGRVLSSQCRV